MTVFREVKLTVPSVETSDGAGVRIRRSIGANPQLRIDPFLMLDEFGSVNPDDYIAGFPSHPHRGFETVTYMLDGEMEHRDHLGNVGLLCSGGVQWMTAGRGVIHSEMPRQEHGLMRGFQLWLNLPAAEKMKPAWYRDLAPDEIPVFATGDGVSTKVVTGECRVNDVAVSGPVKNVSTVPVYLDIRLEAGASAHVSLPATHNAVLYPFEGGVTVAGTIVDASTLGILGDGEVVVIEAGDEPAACLVLAGQPIGEPVAQYGPFVMNTRAELEQAVKDYQDGTLTDT
jgi:redox-sensitive bicupin YhaK (pirin superfamily)